jgi:hypothetical protein
VRLAVAVSLLAWSLSDRPEPDPEIGAELVQKAIDARTGYFVNGRDRVDQDAAEPDQDKLTRTLARWIVRDRVKTINVADLRRHVRLPGLRSPEAVLIALKGLQESGWISRTVMVPDPRDWRSAADVPLEIPVEKSVIAAIG